MNIKKYLFEKCSDMGKIKKYHIDELLRDLKEDKTTLTKLNNFKKRYKVRYNNDYTALNKTEFKQIDNVIKLIENLINEINKTIPQMEYEFDKQQRELKKTSKQIREEIELLDSKELIKYIAYFNLQFKNYNDIEEYKEYFSEILTTWIIIDKKFKSFNQALEKADKLFQENKNIEITHKIEMAITNLENKFLDIPNK